MEQPEPTPAQIAAEPLLKLFRFKHIGREDLRGVVRQYAQLAIGLAENTPCNSERAVALRKLRESKDAACTAITWEE